jgi:hypothetical protein
VHAKSGGSALWLSVKPARVRVTVFDGNENLPVIRELTADSWEVRGRGLHLVDALTDDFWGTAPAAPQGKAVQFVLPATGPGLGLDPRGRLSAGPGTRSRAEFLVG